ncbi:valine--tRNA ligase [Clostridium folliculivorans]|uniref:Valine--tRNA ligase n=1 Tax=Clostridium folliculivorans TaxID=2886038 RepID=A0A9W5Y4V5_9CLOT|nr:valine--tRNA ligase [Clostridium folliculivorans]GKU26487.1 valine--tRNA ligase [Clostridium folliculivorans]GKU29081.1 valine--tRNA ligase [Clostridium folliculivorans]
MLSKKYNPSEVENKWQQYWQDNEIYKYDFNSNKETFSIDTPPPTISGSLHIGHIFSYTQAEIIARFQRMQGKNVFYPFGFDDNGLPTERLVEKEEGIRASSMPRSEFIEKCLNTTKKYEEEFKSLWTAMGFSVDWSLQYETINKRVQRISQKAFIDMAKAGKAYIKQSPVLWCTTCQTSIAQAELEATEKESTFNYIPFFVDGEEIIVATTRPELLYGCVCLFINPEDERYKKYICKTAVVPLYNFEIPIYSDEKVSLEKGTGVVMCATFGDTTDLEWYEKHKLSYKRVVEANGKISDEVPYIGGLKVANARERIIELLRDNNLLIKSEAITHKVSIHERCGKPIEIIPSKQWYIDILSEKEKYLEAADSINWYPASMKTKYINWVENLKWDWCISRQRYYGVPFPLWYCNKCGKTIFPKEEELPINPIETKPASVCSCGCNEFTAETAVFDTWATSSLTPMINADWKGEKDLTKKLIPMGMRTQAHEIIRTWAFYTIVRSLFHTGKLPWKDIMICGFVLAKKGEKISKSKNNGTLSPKDLIDRHSADELRYWSAGARLGTDTMFSEEELKQSKRFITKLWNAASFCIMQLQDFDGERPEELLPIDSWIIEKAKSIEETMKGYLNQYEIGLAKKEVDEFFWSDFCDNYLEIIKDRLYKPEIHGSNERKSAQYALYKSLLEILKLYSIYVPYITEEIYQEYFRAFEKNISIHNLGWGIDVDTEKEKILEFGEFIEEIVSEVRKYKSERNLSLKESLSNLNINMSKEFNNYFNRTLKDLKACTWAENIELHFDEKFSVEIIK